MVCGRRRRGCPRSHRADASSGRGVAAAVGDATANDRHLGRGLFGGDAPKRLAADSAGDAAGAGRVPCPPAGDAPLVARRVVPHGRGGRHCRPLGRLGHDTAGPSGIAAVAAAGGSAAGLWQSGRWGVRCRGRLPDAGPRGRSGPARRVSVRPCIPSHRWAAVDDDEGTASLPPVGSHPIAEGRRLATPRGVRRGVRRNVRRLASLGLARGRVACGSHAQRASPRLRATADGARPAGRGDPSSTRQPAAAVGCQPGGDRSAGGAASDSPAAAGDRQSTAERQPATWGDHRQSAPGADGNESSKPATPSRARRCRECDRQRRVLGNVDARGR